MAPMASARTCLPGPKPPFHAASIEPSKRANDDVTVQHAYDLTIAELYFPSFLQRHNPAFSALKVINTEYSSCLDSATDS